MMLYKEYTRDEHISQSPSLQGWYDQSSRLPLILSIEAPINFANTTTYLNERILRWVEEYEAEYAEEDRKKHSTLRFVVLDLSGELLYYILDKLVKSKKTTGRDEKFIFKYCSYITKIFE